MKFGDVDDDKYISVDKSNTKNELSSNKTLKKNKIKL